MAGVRARSLLVVAAVLAVVAAACGGDSGAGSTTGEQRVSLDALPQPSWMQARGAPEDLPAGPTQTFDVAGRSPIDAIRAYGTVLADAGWDVVTEPQVAVGGPSSWVGEWAHDGNHLEVRAGLPPDFQPSNPPASILTLLLDRRAPSD